MTRTFIVGLSFALLSAGASTGQTIPDIGFELRLQNEIRRQQGEIRALEAQSDRLRTDNTVRRLEAGRAPDPTLELRQYERDTAQAEALLRATQAASTANVARLRAATPEYDRRLRELGYASSLPLTPPR